jgi:hypothetical protein
MTPAAAYLSEICRLYVVVVFLAAATGKVFGFREFEKTVKEGMNLPAHASRYISVAVIAVEVLAALLSFVDGNWAKLGVSLALCLSIAFTGFLATMLVQGKSIRCNCFGQSDDSISWLDLIRNGILISLCLFYLFNSPPAQKISIIAYPLLLALVTIAFLISANFKGITGIMRME